MKDRIELNDVVLLGRTFEEYCRYFQLSDVELRHGTTLDLGAGVSSLSAEARDRGYVVLAADPIYRLPADAIAAKSEADLDNVVRQLPDALHKYNWRFYKHHRIWFEEHLESTLSRLAIAKLVWE